MIYIIADDLTGATDTGVQFSKQGYHVQVVIVPDSQHVVNVEDVCCDADVLVIDTETRERESSAARHRIRHILQHLPVSENDIVYKKIDSTLRGNIGVELDECLKVLNKDICLFTPSLPSNKRISVAGYLIVRDQPLGLSEYYSGSLDPEEASYIPSLLASGTDVSITRIDLKHVMRGEKKILQQMHALSGAGAKILVVDAINDTQLEQILKSSFEFEGSILYAGSAGLANAISGLHQGATHRSSSSKHGENLVLIVSASMSTVTRRQIEQLIQHVQLCTITVDIKKLLSSSERYMETLAAVACQALQERRHTLVYPDPRYLETVRNQKLSAEHHLTFRELGVNIRDFLGILTQPLPCLLYFRSVKVLDLCPCEGLADLCHPLLPFAVTYQCNTL